MTSSRRQVLTYLSFVFLLSSVFYFLIIRAKHLGAGGGYYVFGIMWCPALAAFATLKLNGRSLRDLGWKWPATKYALMSWYTPVLYAGIAYLIVWVSGLGGFPNHEFVASLTTRMGLRVSSVVSVIIYVLLAGSFGMARKCFDCARRGNRLARVLGSRTLENRGVHHYCSDQRDRLVAVALSGSHFRRLQLGHCNLVRIELLHGTGHCHFICICVASAEIGESLDWSPAARQP